MNCTPDLQADLSPIANSDLLPVTHFRGIARRTDLMERDHTSGNISERCFFPLQWRKARSNASAEPIRSTNSRGLALFVLLTELGVSALGSFYSGSLQELPSSLVGGEILDGANIAHSQRFLPIKTVEML